MKWKLGFGVAMLGIVAFPLRAEDWTKESKDRTKRAALHESSMLIRGDSGKWNDDNRVVHAPPLARKPATLSLDAWVDELLKKPVELTEKDDQLLILRTEQLDDNDRLWVERIERRGQKIDLVTNLAKWQGKYFRNFTCYHVVAINLGKLEPGKYELKWVIQPYVFTKFDGDSKAIDTNWPKDERLAEKKATEIRLAFTVKKS